MKLNVSIYHQHSFFYPYYPISCHAVWTSFFLSIVSFPNIKFLLSGYFEQPRCILLHCFHKEYTLRSWCFPYQSSMKVFPRQRHFSLGIWSQLLKQKFISLQYTATYFSVWTKWNDIFLFCFFSICL